MIPHYAKGTLRLSNSTDLLRHEFEDLIGDPAIFPQTEPMEEFQLYELDNDLRTDVDEPWCLYKSEESTYNLERFMQGEYE